MSAWARNNSETRDYIIPGDNQFKIGRERIIAIMIKSIRRIYN